MQWCCAQEGRCTRGGEALISLTCYILNSLLPLLCRCYVLISSRREARRTGTQRRVGSPCAQAGEIPVFFFFKPRLVTLFSVFLISQVEGLPPLIRDVAVGHDHTAAVSATGAAYTWGAGYSGQLGLGSSYAVVSAPRLVEGVEDVAVVACGAPPLYHHRLLISLSLPPPPLLCYIYIYASVIYIYAVIYIYTLALYLS